MSPKANILLNVQTAQVVHAVAAMALAHYAKRDDITPLIMKGRPLDYMRNRLFVYFKEHPEYTHLFMIDSDESVPLDAVDKLLALDAIVATGCYPALAKDGLRWALANKDNDGHYRLLKRLNASCGPFDVDAGGAGCLLVRRDVFGHVDWPWFRWVEYEDGNQMSEDIYFFSKLNDVGIRARVDPTVLCSHYKEVDLLPLKMKLDKLGGETNED